MKILMFGWEFPPFKSGGLGTACYDLTKGLAKLGQQVTFVMPKAPNNAQAEFVKILGTNNLQSLVKIRQVNTLLMPYLTYDAYNELYLKFALDGTGKENEMYGKDIYSEVQRFAALAAFVCESEEHDVIHCHDWMTYPAGIIAKRKSHKPLIAHIHATEFDRTGGNPNTYISHIEYEGLVEADFVIANSNFTKKNVIDHYSINPDKIKVVHWGIDQENPEYLVQNNSRISDKDKIVLFLGRVTIQKGPDYFIEMAKRVLDYEQNVKFVFAGVGDMLPRIMERAAELNIADKVLFTGWLTGADVHKAFKMADLYVMPSVAEPFGLVALESLKNGTPILISKQSGVAEVVTNALKADFWDVDEMTNKVVSVIRHDELHEELKNNGIKEVEKFNLIEPARKCVDVYNEALMIKYNRMH